MTKKTGILGALIVFAGIFCAGSLLSAEPVKEKQEFVVSGTLVAVNVKTRFVIIRHDSRVIKFKASPVICREWKRRLNLPVKVFYQKRNDGSLSIIRILTE